MGAYSVASGSGLPLNIALPVELGADVRKESILVTGELAAVASELPCLDRKCNGLGLVHWLPVGVGDVQVVDTMYKAMR